MKTKKLSELPHFGRNGVTVFWGGVGIGKSNAIVQTVSMNPEAVAIFLMRNYSAIISEMTI